MGVKHPYVFQVDSDIVKEVYNNQSNYKIVMNETCDNQASCAIYFSSNNIYYPNKEEVFRRRIVERNAFEWYNTKVSNVYKHIFVRDIFKQWYLQGINQELNSIEKLAEFLKSEILSYNKVITVGSSAGGFAAALLGSMLNVNRVVAFNAQFELKSLLITSNETIDPILFRKQDSTLLKYYDIKPYLNPKVDIFYFYSMYSDWDRDECKHISEVSTVNIIAFKTKHHGIPFIKEALSKVINLKKTQLEVIAKTNHYPILFSIQMVGLRNVLIGIFRQLKNKYNSNN